MIVVELHLQEELSVGVFGAEQHGAGSWRPGSHGQDQRLLSNDHLLLASRDASDELTVVLVRGDGMTCTEAIAVWKITIKKPGLQFQVNPVFIAISLHHLQLTDADDEMWVIAERIFKYGL